MCCYMYVWIHYPVGLLMFMDMGMHEPTVLSVYCPSTHWLFLKSLETDVQTFLIIPKKIYTVQQYITNQTHDLNNSNIMKDENKPLFYTEVITESNHKLYTDQSCFKLMFARL